VLKPTTRGVRSRTPFRVLRVTIGLGLLLTACTSPVEEPAQLAWAQASDSSDLQKSKVQSPSNVYLLFQIFSSAPDPSSGVLRLVRQKRDHEAIAKEIKLRVGIPRISAHRKLGFSVGPLALDLSSDEIAQVIRDAFDIALEQDLAVAFHLDDYMFWKNARDAHGRKLVANPKNREWKDWQGTPSDPLKVGWLPNTTLAPQMCYESPDVKEAVTRFARDVVASELRGGLARLRRVGKEDLFAGVIVGWESNLADGYCSLTWKGFSATTLPPRFDWEREKIVHDHIERLAKGVRDAGIARDSIYTHVPIIPRRDYEQMRSLPVEKFRRIPQSTNVRAFWTAFNDSSTPGFSAYGLEETLDDIHDATVKHGRQRWALSEGTNIALQDILRGGPVQSGMDWETYLAKLFNRGAVIANIFGGWQGLRGDGEPYKRATESEEAIRAYRKFLRGETLLERKVRREEPAPPGGQRERGQSGHTAEALRFRIGSLPGKIQAYQSKGGDMSAVRPEVERLDQHMRNGDVEKIEKSLDKIEGFLK
jgi:hypothetical protein